MRRSVAERGTVTGDAQTIGEVQTVLLQHSTPAGPALVNELLAFTMGAMVKQSARPMHRATSAEQLTGVDCALPTKEGGTTRGVGTVVSRTGITGGHIAQGTAWTTIVPSDTRRRMPWSHYLARRGVIECLGPTSDAEAYLSAERKAGQLNLTAVSSAALDRLQGRLVDRRPPLRSSRTTLRFAIGVAGPATFAVERRSLVRRLTLPRLDAPVADVIELCEDIARHDWLLTTVLAELSRVRAAAGSDRRVTARLAAVLETLGHLWMPAARLAPPLTDVWAALDGRPGMSRQWQALISRIRDHLMLAMVRSWASGSSPGEESTAR
jgi:hypothetical protein